MMMAFNNCDYLNHENENDILISTLNEIPLQPDNHRCERDETHRKSLTSRRLVVVVLFNLLVVCPPPSTRPCNSLAWILINLEPRYVAFADKHP